MAVFSLSQISFSIQGRFCKLGPTFYFIISDIIAIFAQLLLINLLLIKETIL